MPARLSPLRSLAVLLAVSLAAAGLAAAARAWQLQQPGADRSPQSARPANRLAGETSPYLLQHAHNPVDWYPWGPEAFAKAKKEGKPVFLSVGYSSCHWCHVMERESFEDEGIAQLLNSGFVAIKVDREERPDVDEIYMTAVQMLAGRGGWPMSTFLTPEGKPFFGGAYFPRDEFAELLRKVHETWTDPEQRKKLDDAAERVSRAMGEAAARAPEPGSVSPALLAPAVNSYLADFDEQHGGFGGAPKFPPSLRLALLLAGQRKKPDPKALHAVTATLDAMARGGMYDQVGGGFHRYSTDEKWLAPHFEKMLYDQALLSWVYLEAYQVTKSASYRRTATETLDFVLRELRDPKGGFWSTLDADSPAPNGEKAEGRFYLWTPNEVVAALGEKDGGLFNRVYAITPAGNFEGRSIPNLIAKPVEAWAKELKTPESVLRARLDGMRKRLLAAREKRPRPSLDDKVLANWNGLMLRSLALAYETTGDERYRQAAEKAAEFLLSTMRPDGKLLHSYRDGKTGTNAFLEDYSYLSVGLLQLHHATGDPRWLKEAQALAGTMIADFWDEKTGVFFSTPRGHEQLLIRVNSAEDGATPSGQSMAALALVRLARLTGNKDFHATAQRVLDTYATQMKRYPAAMPAMLLAAQAYFTPEESAPGGALKDEPVTVTLSGAPPALEAGQEFEVAVRFSLQPGWHINADRPADPKLVPTAVQPEAGPFKLLSAAYPPAQTVRLGFSKVALKVYTGETTVRLRLKALPGAAAARLRLRVRYQACNDRLCRPPVQTVLSLPPVTEAAPGGEGGQK